MFSSNLLDVIQHKRLRMILVIIFNIFAPPGISSYSIDLRTCKLTHTGTEYIGRLSRTETNVTCQYWNSATQKGSENVVDEAFPDGSKALAKNYCRNPTKDPKGPWCFTTQQKLLFDTCEVPLCQSLDCRVSGTGMEYVGTIKKSSSGKKCTKWKDTHKLKEKHKEATFKDKYFPEGSSNQADSYCRNPDGNLAGPWCYVEKDDSDLHEKELCDVPFCDDLGTIMYSEGSTSGQYYFFSSLNETQSIEFSFRLWNPSDWLGGQAFFFLSAYDVAINRDEIERWKSGVEVLISHSGSLIISKEEEEVISKTPLILTGANWTNFLINWINPDNASILIQVFDKSKAKPIAISELYIEGTIFEVETFRYFSLGGSPGFWNIQQKEDDCVIHTVPQMNFTRFWLVQKTTLGKDVEVYVRGTREAVLLFRSAPMIDVNEVQVTIGDKDKIKVFTYNEKGDVRQLAESTWPNLLNFWKWESFKITLLQDKLQMFWVRDTATELVVETNHPNIERLMWVSFASPWVSYWTIYCDPRGIADPPPPSPPECVTQEGELFNGTLSVTKQGRQCIPWTDEQAIPEQYHNEDLFTPYGGKTSCQNFCRNLDNDPKGAYCIVRDSNSETGFGSEHCHPRSCRLGDCKLAGTGNDYTGKLNITRSKRECKSWVAVQNELIRINNFPDPALKDTGNYCRNPSKSLTGNWCYTNDPRVPRDECFIRDCDKPLECTILVSGYLKDTFTYILPKWRKYGLQFWLKAWNPDLYEGFVVSMLSMNLKKEYLLVMGDEDNEKLKFYYKSDGTEILLQEKTLPHLVPTGKWSGYWLRPGRGKVELGYYATPVPFFEWVSVSEDQSFEPIFINFGTLNRHWIGVNFPCFECLTERTSMTIVNKMYPINLWKEENWSSELQINLRGKGAAIITLIWTPEFTRLFGIQIFSVLPQIDVVQFTSEDDFKVLATFPVEDTMSDTTWSNYIIRYTETNLTLYKDSAQVLNWQSSFPLLFYWFSVSAQEGTVTWSANCPPAEIDGEPRDGHWGRWSPWSCSVTCGKGEGQIQRLCNDPPPNVFGKECKGSPTYEGPCNDFPCGEISPGTTDKIRQYLSTQHKSLQVNAKDKVVLTCNVEAIELIISEVAEVNITWTHNGFPYSKTKFHMDENFSLVISHAQEKHNGVYLCMAYQDPYSIPSKIVLEVVSLVVIKSKPTKKIRKGGSMNLKCNGLALSYVYGDLAQSWELNGSEWKNYGLGTLQAFTIDKLENISDDHEGVWTCVVIQEDFGFKWITNWVYLKVKSAPSFWSHLMEDVATAPVFGKLGNERNVMILFFGLITAFVGIIVLITIFLVKWLRK